MVSLARYLLELMSDDPEDALESLSGWGEDDPPSNADEVEQDELEVCLRAPI